MREVAWSQRKLDSPKLAERYIQGSNGEIRTVVGVNPNDTYREKQRKGAETTDVSATFSVWRAKLDNSSGETNVTVEESVRNQVPFLPMLQSRGHASNKIGFPR